LSCFYASLQYKPSSPPRRSSDLVPGLDQPADRVAPRRQHRPAGLEHDDRVGVGGRDLLDQAVLVAVVVRALEQDGLIEKVAAAKDRKSTRLNSSHVSISYAVFCL